MRGVGRCRIETVGGARIGSGADPGSHLTQKVSGWLIDTSRDMTYFYDHSHNARNKEVRDENHPRGEVQGTMPGNA